MAEMVLPGVYIDVRPEGLIVPTRVSVSNVGIVGTASKGPVHKPVLLGNYGDARQVFGDYDAWQKGEANELTLVRALEQVFNNGATTAIAVRVAAATAVKHASLVLKNVDGATWVTLTAATPGSAGNSIEANVSAADDQPFIENEVHPGKDPVTLDNTPVRSSRNRVRQLMKDSGATRSLTVLYDGDPAAGQVKIDLTSKELKFGEKPKDDDTIWVSYAAPKESGAKVTIREMRGGEVAARETYTVVDGNDLARDINDPLAPSRLVTATAGSAAQAAKKPKVDDPDQPDVFVPFKDGNDGADAGAGDYKDGLDLLLNENAHIIVAAGQDLSFGDEIDAHCQNASTDAIKRDRIGVVGGGIGAKGGLDALRGHTLASDRVLVVGPGISVTDSAGPGQPDVTLSGAYAAAAVAGRLAHFPPHVSLTNKTLMIGGIEEAFSQPELAALLQSRVCALEKRQGYRIVRGITSSTNTAWQQITTRRIVDYAKYGVRSAAESYIGLLNNIRVRGALKATVNSFLAEMVEDEMLTSYELDVTATRDDEIKGIAKVTMVLQPVFSIDFIKVTMFLK